MSRTPTTSPCLGQACCIWPDVVQHERVLVGNRYLGTNETSPKALESHPLLCHLRGRHPISPSASYNVSCVVPRGPCRWVEREVFISQGDYTEPRPPEGTRLCVLLFSSFRERRVRISANGTRYLATLGVSLHMELVPPAPLSPTFATPLVSQRAGRLWRR